MLIRTLLYLYLLYLSTNLVYIDLQETTHTNVGPSLEISHGVHYLLDSRYQGIPRIFGAYFKKSHTCEEGGTHLTISF